MIELSVIFDDLARRSANSGRTMKLTKTMGRIKRITGRYCLYPIRGWGIGHSFIANRLEEFLSFNSHGYVFDPTRHIIFYSVSLEAILVRESQTNYKK